MKRRDFLSQFLPLLAIPSIIRATPQRSHPAPKPDELFDLPPEYLPAMELIRVDRGVYHALHLINTYQGFYVVRTFDYQKEPVFWKKHIVEVTYTKDGKDVVIMLSAVMIKDKDYIEKELTRIMNREWNRKYNPKPNYTYPEKS